MIYIQPINYCIDDKVELETVHVAAYTKQSKAIGSFFFVNTAQNAKIIKTDSCKRQFRILEFY